MVGSLYPPHNARAELLATVTYVLVEDVLLEESEEAFHGGVVTGSADPAHAPDSPVTGRSSHECAGTELASAVAAYHTAHYISAHAFGVFQGLHGESSLHPGIDGVPHDPH